ALLALGAARDLGLERARPVSAQAGDEALDVVDRSHRPPDVPQQRARHDDYEAHADVEQRRQLEDGPQVDRPEPLAHPESAPRLDLGSVLAGPAQTGYSGRVARH